MNLGEAISIAMAQNMWHHMPGRSRVFVYRNIASAIGYQDAEHSDLKLWQDDRENRGY